MKRDNQSFLQDVFSKYWMTRCPELDESEAIDHLEWDLRSRGHIPPLSKTGMVSGTTKRRLKSFLNEKTRVKTRA